RGRQQHGLAVEVCRDRALGLLGEASGLEADGAGAEAAVVENGLGGGDFRTFQEVSPSLFRLARPCDARVLAKERMRADISARAFPRISPALATSRRSLGAVCDEEPTTGDQLLSRPLRVSRYAVDGCAEATASSLAVPLNPRAVGLCCRRVRSARSRRAWLSGRRRRCGPAGGATTRAEHAGATTGGGRSARDRAGIRRAPPAPRHAGRPGPHPPRRRGSDGPG